MHTYHTSDKSLHQLILEAIPAIYLDDTKYEYLGFGQRSALEIIAPIWDTYRIIDNDLLAENLEKSNSLAIPNPYQADFHPTQNMSNFLYPRKLYNHRYKQDQISSCSHQSSSPF